MSVANFIKSIFIIHRQKKTIRLICCTNFNSYQTMCCSGKNDEKENTYYKNFPARASLLAEAYNVIGSQLSRGFAMSLCATTIPSLIPCESEYVHSM